MNVDFGLMARHFYTIIGIVSIVHLMDHNLYPKKFEI
ncbi:hypothetical protein ENHY17A_50293 [Moraxellaceae bacterium 17A]|nr:hypothetical protein ENHY17A_50293 [Moraxellaceae bacterium 17A]